MPVRYNRYPIRLPVVYQAESSKTGKAGIGWTRNLCEGGACVELDERLEPGTPLTVRMQTDRGPIEAKAEVVWVGGEGSAWSGIPHGLSFTEVAPNQRQQLHDMLLPLSMVPHADVRLPLDIPVQCQRKDAPGESFEGHTANMSREGLLLCLPQVLSPGTVLTMTLRTSKGPITVDGAVVWAEPPEEGKPAPSVRHGLRFMFLSWSSSLALGLLLTESK
jgi:c-di-GMP-binding flagellar brake protein YcgR